MKMLNRSAINVRLQQPFVDWINNLPGGTEEKITLAEVNQEATTYLLPELEDEQDLNTLLEEYHLDLLENELLSWEEDSQFWPTNRDKHLFTQFLQVELAFMAFDLDEQTPLLRQSLET